MAENFKIQTTEDVAGLNLVKGFKVAGAACDIRNKNDMSRLDVALIVSDIPATGSGVFTTNDVKAAPVVFQRYDEKLYLIQKTVSRFSRTASESRYFRFRLRENRWAFKRCFR